MSDTDALKWRTGGGGPHGMSQWNLVHVARHRQEGYLWRWGGELNENND